jgi:RNA polymerase sigma factor (sigma-70 family)
VDATSIQALPRPPRLRVLRLLSDESLARRVADGDRAAFGEVFVRYQEPIYRYCRSILRSEEDARDALQNTMASAMRGLEGEDRAITLRPWLYRIAHNESMTLARRRREHSTLDEASLPVSRSAEDAALAGERRRELVEDLGALPERQRSALVMRELSGLPHQEIAAALAISPGAAKQAIYEARTMLQEISEGRAMACADVQRLISDGDGRVLRRRNVRAHLRACGACTTYRQAISTRSEDLRAIAPPLAPAAAAAILHGLLGGSSAAGASASAGVAATAVAGTGKLVGGSAATKLAVVAATAAVGVGGVAVTQEVVRDSSPAPVTRTAPVAPRAGGTAIDGTAESPEAPRASDAAEQRGPLDTSSRGKRTRAHPAASAGEHQRGNAQRGRRRSAGRADARPRPKRSASRGAHPRAHPQAKRPSPEPRSKKAARRGGRSAAHEKLSGLGARSGRGNRAASGSS